MRGGSPLMPRVQLISQVECCSIVPDLVRPETEKYCRVVIPLDVGVTLNTLALKRTSFASENGLAAARIASTKSPDPRNGSWLGF